MIERRARKLCRPGYFYMSELIATRSCHHFLSYRVHPQLEICCGCGHTTPSSYAAAVIREAFE
jgi:hypothetical protein